MNTKDETIAGAAPDLPLYYYHIPALSGVHILVIDLLRAAERDCPALAGVKFTFEDVMDLSRCVAFADGRYDMLFGRDEMLLSGLVVGVRGAVMRCVKPKASAKMKKEVALV